MNSIEALSTTYGTGNWAADLSLVMLGVSIVALVWGMVALLSSRRREPRPNPQGFADRSIALGGRLEKLERAFNEMRTEVLRSVELTHAEQERIRGELAEVRAKVGLESVSTGVRGELARSAEIAADRGGAAEAIAAPLGVGERVPVDVGGEVRDAADAAEAVGGDIPPLLEPSPQTVEPAPGSIVAAPPPVEPESLSQRLRKSRVGLFERLRGVFAGKPKLDQAMVEELEALLVGSDLGVKTVAALMSEVRAELQRGDEVSEGALAATLKLKILNLLEKDAPLLPIIRPLKRPDGPLVVMMVGVNGVGKTTTTAKLAALWRESGAKVLMVAADTFRAAAVEQLQTWGERIGVPVVTGAPEAKPQTVVFDALARAKAEGFDVVVIDTAGRLHTKSNLMQELEGIRNIAERHQAGAPHETVLVVDGSTGQNAIAQAREFNAAVPLTGLIVTKLDGTPKGGVVVAIKSELGVPVRYIGVGEGSHDLRPFIPRDFVEALFDTSDLEDGAGEVVSAHAETRRRRRRDTQPYD